MNLDKYFGGTGITLEKLKEMMPTINVDGTTYQVEDWLKECAKFDALVQNKSKLWIPYSVWEQGPVTEIVWQRYEFKNYTWPAEMKDWWIAEPYAKVLHDNLEYYVYEITFYKNWRRKTHMKHLMAQRKKAKRTFLTRDAIIDMKKQQVIANSQEKRNKKK